jgi:hypothetical protein
MVLAAFQPVGPWSCRIAMVNDWPRRTPMGGPLLDILSMAMRSVAEVERVGIVMALPSPSSPMGGEAERNPRIRHVIGRQAPTRPTIGSRAHPALRYRDHRRHTASSRCLKQGFGIGPSGKRFTRIPSAWHWACGPASPFAEEPDSRPSTEFHQQDRSRFLGALENEVQAILRKSAKPPDPQQE